MLLNGTGRPEKVYGKKCEEENLEHEVGITEAEYWMGGDFVRNARIGEAIADGRLNRDGIRYWIEVDNGSMTSKQMRKKWQRYGKLKSDQDVILVICHTKTRLRRLMKTAVPIKHAVLFTRFRWLRSTVVKEPWIDSRCKRVSI